MFTKSLHWKKREKTVKKTNRCFRKDPSPKVSKMTNLFDFLMNIRIYKIHFLTSKNQNIHKQSLGEPFLKHRFRKWKNFFLPQRHGDPKTAKKKMIVLRRISKILEGNGVTFLSIPRCYTFNQHVVPLTTNRNWM